MKKAAALLLMTFFLTGYSAAFWDSEWEAGQKEDAYSREALDSTLAGETSCPKIAALSFIRLYQLTLSGNTGSSCVFYPSCSRYGFFAVEKYGAIKGCLMSAERVIRCNPWTCGYDLDADTGLYYDPPEAESTADFIFGWTNF
jgi:putative membrane protein insertion efficiency factor